MRLRLRLRLRVRVEGSGYLVRVERAAALRPLARDADEAVRVREPAVTQRADRARHVPLGVAQREKLPAWLGLGLRLGLLTAAPQPPIGP